MKVLFGSEGLCPHCKYRNKCRMSTYRMNKFIHGGGVTYSVAECNSINMTDNKYYFEMKK